MLVMAFCVDASLASIVTFTAGVLVGVAVGRMTKTRPSHQVLPCHVLYAVHRYSPCMAAYVIPSTNFYVGRYLAWMTNHW